MTGPSDPEDLDSRSDSGLEEISWEVSDSPSDGTQDLMAIAGAPGTARGMFAHYPPDKILAERVKRTLWWVHVKTTEEGQQ